MTAFAYPSLLWCLVALPFAVLVVRRHVNTRSMFAARWIGSPPTSSRWYADVAVLAYLLALLLLAVAAGGPIGRESSQPTGTSRAIIVIDVSMSMGVADLEPTRLEAAKAWLRDLVEGLRADQIGIVAVGADARLVCPLTRDRSAVRDALLGLSHDSAAAGGSNIAAGLARARRALNLPTSSDRIIVMTDGENDDGLAMVADATTRPPGAAAPRLSVVGVGSIAGGRIPLRGGTSGEVQADEQGQPLTSRLQESGLMEYARAQGGTYQRLRPGERLSSADSDNAGSAAASRLRPFGPVQRYGWLVAAAALLLLTEFVIQARKVAA